MQTKPKMLSAAIAAALAMGLVGEASASIYARSYLEFNNLQIAIIDSQGNAGATIRNFQMSAANSASLNGTTVQATDFICQGNLTTNNCGPVGTRVDALAVNGIGSAPVRANNDFSFFGPSLNEYANADSNIFRSELTGDGPSFTKQIAETELQTGTSARANAELQSITALTFSFTINNADTNRLLISFDALSSSFVQINDAAALFATAQSNLPSLRRRSRTGTWNSGSKTTRRASLFCGGRTETGLPVRGPTSQRSFRKSTPQTSNQTSACRPCRCRVPATRLLRRPALPPWLLATSRRLRATTC